MNQPPKDERTGRDRATAVRVSAISVIANALLAVFKLLFGLLAHSGALVSDAANAASDVFFTLIVMGGVIISARDPDCGHTYGHERMESLASILLAASCGDRGRRSPPDQKGVCGRQALHGPRQPGRMTFPQKNRIRS